MASRRRSVEEKNLKLLRELAALPANKQCFDCHQRGPTYINVTIGSFVCTSCSGILRGLTPPHRVKSITMTTFTPEEIELLRNRGNEYCRCVWLGTYDSRTSNIESEGKDEHRKRDLMVQKYEKKRWYVDPEIAVKKMQHDQLLLQKQTMQVAVTNNSRPHGRIPEVQPLSQLLGRTPTALVVENNMSSETWPHPVSSASAPTITTTKNSSQSQGARSIDLLSGFASDTFVSSSSTQSVATANGNFANFESAFNSSDLPVNPSTSITTMPTSVSLDAYPAITHAAKELTFGTPMPPTSSANTPQSNVDRYAALADLDSLFHQPSSPNWTVESSSAITTTATSVFEFSTTNALTSNVFTTAPSNPFSSGSGTWPQTTPNTQSIFAAANPFQNPSESCLPYQQQQINQAFVPLPVVGNSPSDDSIRSQFNLVGGNNANFASFPTQEVSNPPNGFRGNQFYAQNGEFIMSPTGNNVWGMPATTVVPPAWSTSQFGQSAEKNPPEFSQYSDWKQSPANPFMASGNMGVSAAPRPNPSNPFL